MSLAKAVKNRLTGVSWRHPAVVAVMPIADLVDLKVRERRGLGYLTPYSARIRSTGFEKAFGGSGFKLSGALTADQLISLAALMPNERLLDVGSGAGRVAFALSDYLDHGKYTGIDIDWPQVTACRNNRLLSEHGYQFALVDLDSDLYNPGGVEDATSFRFPFPDGSFDLVTMFSVFTHLLPDECANYAAETMRVLAPGGRCVVTTYLQDQGHEGGRNFPHQMGKMWVQFPDNPRKAIGHEAAVLDGWFGVEAEQRLTGTWRGQLAQQRSYQDWVIYRKS
jgi:SAM-dependent methyltransferase